MTTKQEAISHLQSILKPGDTVYTVLRHVSRSGMSRRIDLYVIRDNRPEYLTGLVCAATGLRRGKDGAVVSGSGFNHARHVVDGLENVLWGDAARLACETL